MQFTPEEYGSPLPPAKPVDPQGQPRGDAHFPLPHPSQFGSVANWATKTYSYLFDEAIAHSIENAERMRLDPVIDYCMRLLCEPISLLSHSIEPDDPEDETQVKAAEKAQKLLKRIPGITDAKYNLLDEGNFVGRAGQQIRWQYQYKQGKTWMLPTGFRPIQGDKLVWHFDGRVGVRVMAGSGLRTEPTDYSQAYFVTPEEREQLIVHSVHPTDASFWKPLKAGQVNGVGLRDKLYWLWALKTRVWGMSMDFLQWFAKGLTIYYFAGHNDQHRQQIQAFVEAQDGSSALFMPWWASDANFKPVERINPSTASPEFLMRLITEYFDSMIRYVILGQVLTSGNAPQGLGSANATAHQTTFDNKVKYLSVALDETLTRDLLGPFYKANFPGVPCGHWVSDLDDPNAQAMLEAAERIYAMGGAVPEQPLMDAAGLPAVKPGDTVLTQIDPMQPAATDATPLGTPVQEGGADQSQTATATGSPS